MVNGIKMQQQTAVTEILNHCKELISEGHEIDTQGLVHWIEDTLLEMEKQRLKDAYAIGREGKTIAEFNKTFKSE
jgi:hypothetical protein